MISWPGENTWIYLIIQTPVQDRKPGPCPRLSLPAVHRHCFHRKTSAHLMSRKLSGQFLWQLFWWECQTGRETWPPPHLHGNLATYTRGHLFRLCCKFKQITSIKIISVSLAVWPVSETQVFSLIGCNQSFDPVKFVSSNPSHPPPKSLLTINLGHLGTWKGIQVQTSSLLTMRRDCTDAWCIAIYFALCKFWIKLVHVYECLEKLRLNSFCCYAGQVPEIQNWLKVYCLRH